MPQEVQNLTGQDLKSMWNGIEYFVPAGEAKVFPDDVAQKFARDHNRRQYGTPADEKKGQLPGQIKQVAVHAVDVAEYVRQGAAPAKQVHRHDDGTEFDNIPDLLAYTTEKARKDLLAEQAARQAKQPTPPSGGHGK